MTLITMATEVMEINTQSIKFMTYNR